MKFTRIIIALFILSMGISCVNRTTNKEKEIETEASDVDLTPSSMYQTSGNANEGRTDQEMEIIQQAENTLKNFFEALDNKEFEKAYSMMSADKSNRGTMDSFKERYSYDSISLDVVGSATEIAMDPAKVTLPTRYTVKQKESASAYNGTITLEKLNTENGFKITTITVEQE